MRQGQQNRRGRGRNRKGHHHNPLARSFESNGPDVKIRGTPAHIAEKYISLARDAQASGDPVLAENYLQHAEHYNRIIMSYREQQMQQAGDMMNGGAGRFRPMPGAEPMDGPDELGEEDGEDMPFEGQPVIRRQEPQPRAFEPQPRPPYRDRFSEQRPMQGSERPDRAERNPEASVADQPSAQARGEPPRRRDRMAEAHEQPEFLRRPVRRPRRDGAPRQQNGGNGSDGESSASQDEDPIDKTPA
ncbi:MAG TPA: DUF4167 domain-containing protein [Hyphomicrobiaceae bacterium]|nr:DUF4167 domain-containing protein [Hyphomicrobiaceae bacterium]